MPEPKQRQPRWPMVVLTLGMLAIGGAGGYGLRLVTEPETGKMPAAFSRLVTTYDTIEAGYYQKTTTNRLVDGAVSGMMASLNDPYSAYLQNTEKDALDSTMDASFGGIGATIQQSGDRLTIESILADTPAKKAGLKVGDELLKVNGKSVTGKSVTAAVAKIRGKIGTKVTLTIRRDGATQTVPLTRAKITTKTVTGTLADANKQVGIITIATFSNPTADEFKQTVKTLRKKGAKSFVLDLRGDPGGGLDTALAIASMGLKNGQTMMQMTADGKTQRFKAGKAYDGGFKVTEPMAVLIDGDSASASEILAAALSENANIPLIGEASYGKGVVQSVMPLTKTSDLKLTTAKWLTPNGTWINGKGLKPTVPVTYPDYMHIKAISKPGLKLGDESGDVRALQQLLIALDTPVEPANGYFGPTTETALKAFQGAHGLPVTGVAEQDTITALTTALLKQFAANDPMVAQALRTLSQPSAVAK